MAEESNPPIGPTGRFPTPYYGPLSEYERKIKERQWANDQRRAVRNATHGQFANDSGKAGYIYAPDLFNQETGAWIGGSITSNKNLQSPAAIAAIEQRGRNVVPTAKTYIYDDEEGGT